MYETYTDPSTQENRGEFDDYETLKNILNKSSNKLSSDNILFRETIDYSVKNGNEEANGGNYEPSDEKLRKAIYDLSSPEYTDAKDFIVNLELATQNARDYTVASNPSNNFRLPGGEGGTESERINQRTRWQDWIQDGKYTRHQYWDFF